MLGSHNSMSYLPIKGWRKILRPWIECQNKNLKDQYNLGVRYFDLRFKLIDGLWHLCHNQADLGELEDHMDEISFLGRSDIRIRAVLDERNKPKYSIEYKNQFLVLVEMLAIDYKLKIDSIIVFWEWKEYGNRSIAQLEYHNSVISSWYDYLWSNKKFAKDNNQEYLSKIKNLKSDPNNVYLIDYIQYGSQRN